MNTVLCHCLHSYNSHYFAMLVVNATQEEEDFYGIQLMLPYGR